MKKRSLFAAVAMLIVSALVLTSATYAWFTAGGPATVGTIRGNTIDSAAGVMVKHTGTGATWGTTLTQAQLAAALDSSSNAINKFATTYTMNTSTTPATEVATGTYVPVSSKEGKVFKAYQYNGGAYKQQTLGGGTGDQWYDDFYFTAATTNQGDAATLNIKWNSCSIEKGAVRVAVFTKRNTAANSTYASVAVNNTTGVITGGSAEASTVYAVVTDIADSVGLAEAGTTNMIIDSGDTNVPANALEAQTIIGGIDQTDGLDIDLGVIGDTAGTSGTRIPTDIHVLIWIEGNDDECVPLKAAEKDLNLTFKLTAYTPTP